MNQPHTDITDTTDRTIPTTCSTAGSSFNSKNRSNYNLEDDCLKAHLNLDNCFASSKWCKQIVCFISMRQQHMSKEEESCQACRRSSVIIKTSVAILITRGVWKDRESQEPTTESFCQRQLVTWYFTLRRRRAADVGEEVIDVGDRLGLNCAVLRGDGLQSGVKPKICWTNVLGMVQMCQKTNQNVLLIQVLEFKNKRMFVLIQMTHSCLLRGQHRNLIPQI